MARIFFLLAALSLATGSLFSQKTANQTATNQINAPQRITVGSPTGQFEEIHLLIEGKTKSVSEGDTITVQSKDKKTYQIRLQAIDAPESNQPFSEPSRKKLSDSLLGKDVTVIVRKVDKTAELYLGTVYSGGEDINLRQIENGMAWHSQQNGHEQTDEARTAYAAAEQKARESRKGLWDTNEPPASPWDFKATTQKPATDKITQPNAEKEIKIPASVNNETILANPAGTTSKPSNENSGSGRKYIKGPRGGCYYINSNGNKSYVDRSLCS